MIIERRHNNMNDNKLTRKIKEIRKFAKFGLVIISQHALDRCKERNITQRMIIEMLADNNNTICQYQEHYKGAEFASYVIWAKASNNKYYHIVIYDEITPLGSHKYKVSTVYEPSRALFSCNGRYLKKKKNRKIIGI